MTRVPPSVRMKEEIEALLRGEGQAEVAADPPMDGFVRGTAQYMLQVAIEAEATAFLGRGHYRRGDRTRIGWRNGYEPKGVQTEAGLLGLAGPPGQTFALGQIIPADSVVKYTVIYCRLCNRIITVLPPTQ